MKSKVLVSKKYNEVCQELIGNIPEEPAGEINLSSNKIFIDYLHLGALKIITTLRLEKKAVIPTQMNAILLMLYSVVVRIS